VTPLDGGERDPHNRQEADPGAYTDRITVYTVREDGSTVPVMLDGTPAVFPVGASVRHSAGSRCDAQSHLLRAYSGESDDGQTYAVTWRDVRLENGTLTEVGTAAGPPMWATTCSALPATSTAPGSEERLTALAGPEIPPELSNASVGAFPWDHHRSETRGAVQR
jgi:uncharacterized protein YbjT (DUF2867 family)